MKENKNLLKLFCFSTPLMNTEIYSILGDKYLTTLPFEFELVDQFEASDIVLWDGVVTAKNKKTVEKILSTIGPNRLLLLLGESMTLFKAHPLVELVKTESENFVELPGWNLLPEEILNALLECHKKLNHV